MLTNILPLKRSENQYRGVAEQAGAPGCAGSSLAGGVASPRLRYSLRLLAPFSQAMSGCSPMIAFSAASSSDLISAGRSSASLSDAGVSWRRTLIAVYSFLRISYLVVKDSGQRRFSFPFRNRPLSVFLAPAFAARHRKRLVEKTIVRNLDVGGMMARGTSWWTSCAALMPNRRGYRPCVYRCLLRFIFKSHQLNCLLPRGRRVRCANMPSSPVRHNADDHYGAIDCYRFVF